MAAAVGWATPVDGGEGRSTGPFTCTAIDKERIGYLIFKHHHLPSSWHTVTS